MTVRKLSRMLSIINFIMFLLGTGILIGLWNNWFESSDRILILTWGILLLSCILSIGGFSSVSRYQNRNYHDSMKNLENQNSKLREQRHDYLNQLQIVYGLLELEEYTEARDYLDPVFKDIMKVNRALKTSQPAVNALLQAKMDEAESQDIDFFLEVASQLSELAIEPWELCKVLGNLIDNAVAAVEKLPGEKRISLEIRETKEAYLFDVRNNGPIIQKEYRKLIFHQGFTTKGGTDHGMGLSIVSAIVKEARGSITYESTEEETCFRVTIPKKERKEGWQWKL